MSAHSYKQARSRNYIKKKSLKTDEAHSEQSWQDRQVISCLHMSSKCPALTLLLFLCCPFISEDISSTVSQESQAGLSCTNQLLLPPLSCFSSSLAALPGFPPAVLCVSLTLADRGAALGPCSGLLASLVEQRVAGGVEIFDLHLVVVHTHGGQSAGHLFLWERKGRGSVSSVKTTPVRVQRVGSINTTLFRSVLNQCFKM